MSISGCRVAGFHDFCIVPVWIDVSAMVQCLFSFKTRQRNEALRKEGGGRRRRFRAVGAAATAVTFIFRTLLCFCAVYGELGSFSMV